MTCDRAQEFLARHKVRITETVDARKKPVNKKAALALAAQASVLFTAKGKRVVQVDLARERPAPDRVAELIVGPTGNLRAPTLRIGQTLLVGYDEATYKQVLGA